MFAKPKKSPRYSREEVEAIDADFAAFSRNSSGQQFDDFWYSLLYYSPFLEEDPEDEKRRIIAEINAAADLADSLIHADPQRVEEVYFRPKSTPLLKWFLLGLPQVTPAILRAALFSADPGQAARALANPLTPSDAIVDFAHTCGGRLLEKNVSAALLQRGIPMDEFGDEGCGADLN